MLIIDMLEKDPNMRPSIWDICNKPFIYSRINKFVEENKCEDQVLRVFEVKKEVEEAQSKNKSDFGQSDDKLETYAHLIRNDI